MENYPSPLDHLGMNLSSADEIMRLIFQVSSNNLYKMVNTVFQKDMSEFYRWYFICSNLDKLAIRYKIFKKTSV